MTTLRQLQCGFQRYVLHGERDIARHIDSTQATADERLMIYAEAYRLRLIEALQTDFVALRGLLGDAGFNELACGYIDAHPSTRPSLRDFGRQLPSFLARDGRYRAEPALAELAAFEWALTEAFDAPDAPALNAETLAALPPARWAGLRLPPHPSLQRIDLSWNVPAIWNAVDSGTPPPAAESAPHPIGWAIWRQQFKIYFRSLPPDEAQALDTLRAGGDFATLCEGLCAWVAPQQAAAHAAGLLKQWVADGLLSGLCPEQLREF